MGKTKNTVVINCLGGPGVGKSTLALGLAHFIKTINGVVSEYIPEYAKECVWADTTHTLDNQVYIGAKQYHRQFKVKGKVDFIITDAPLIMQLYYGENSPTGYSDLILALQNEIPTVNIFLVRNDSFEFEAEGRLQTLEEAQEIDRKIKAILDNYNVPYICVDAGDTALPQVINYLAKQGYIPPELVKEASLKQLRASTKTILTLNDTFPFLGSEKFIKLCLDILHWKISREL